jgi:exodeoxyribonuclease VIII
MIQDQLQLAIEAGVTDISIDLETLGKRPGAPIVAIGLAGFCRKTGASFELSYSTIDLQSAITHSTGVDPSTLEWWLKQEPAAIEQTFNDTTYRTNLFAALGEVDVVFARLNNAKPWGNGATFDISILEATFALVGNDAPWAHWDVRDVRTIVDLGKMLIGFDPKKAMPFEGTKHNALADAVHQAKYTVAIIQELKGYCSGRYANV